MSPGTAFITSRQVPDEGGGDFQASHPKLGGKRMKKKKEEEERNEESENHLIKQLL